VRRYIEKMTGLRPGAGHAADRALYGQRTGPGDGLSARRFAQLYTRADIELLASVDEAHETLSGPATRRILEREHEVYKQPE